MRMIYLYDRDNWAVHNLGKLIQPHLEAEGVTVELRSMARFIAAPERFDILYAGYPGLLERFFDYRPWADEFITTIHDPIEISNFTNTLHWPARPFYPMDLSLFDRVSTISHELLALTRPRYRADAILTPTFPHEADRVRAAALPVRLAGPVRFFASANASPYYPWKELAWRPHILNRYLRRHDGRLSLRQMTSLGILTTRKNLPLLRRIGRALERLRGAEVQFRTGKATGIGYADYVTRLAAADVYVCTSNMEGGPLPVMEAVLAGLAVLTTPVGQVSDWVVDGENGFICRTYAEFMAASRRYVADPALLERHRAASRQRAAERTFDFAPWRGFLLGQPALAPPPGRLT